MSTSTTEHMDVSVEINTQAIEPTYGKERRYEVIMRTASGARKQPVFEYQADRLTFGEVQEILAAIHHSRNGRNVLIPYLNMSVEPQD